MPIPTQAQAANPNSNANGLTQQQIVERVCALLAMLATGQAPDGTVVPVGGAFNTTGTYNYPPVPTQPSTAILVSGTNTMAGLPIPTSIASNGTIWTVTYASSILGTFGKVGDTFSAYTSGFAPSGWNHGSSLAFDTYTVATPTTITVPITTQPGATTLMGFVIPEPINFTQYSPFGVPFQRAVMEMEANFTYEQSISQLFNGQPGFQQTSIAQNAAPQTATCTVTPRTNVLTIAGTCPALLFPNLSATGQGIVAGSTVSQISYGAPTTTIASGTSLAGANIPVKAGSTTAGFPSTGTFTVTNPSAQTITYTGLTAEFFTGCTGGSSSTNADATATGGTSTTQATLLTKITSGGANAQGPGTIYTGAQIASSTITGISLAVTSTAAFPSAGFFSYTSSGFVTQIVQYTSTDATHFLGCTLISAANGNLNALANVILASATLQQVAFPADFVGPQNFLAVSEMWGNGQAVMTQNGDYFNAPGQGAGWQESYWGGPSFFAVGGASSLSNIRSVNVDSIAFFAPNTSGPYVIGIMAPDVQTGFNQTSPNQSATAPLGGSVGTQVGIGVGFFAYDGWSWLPQNGATNNIGLINPSSTFYPSTQAITLLTAAATLTAAGNTTLNVMSTVGFPSSGTLAFQTSKGLTFVSYTGSTATTFTTCNLIANQSITTTLFLAPNQMALSAVATTASSTQSLPGTPLAVTSTTGFSQAGVAYLMTSGGTQVVTYTSTDATHLIGANGGTSSIASGNAVCALLAYQTIGANFTVQNTSTQVALVASASQAALTTGPVIVPLVPGATPFAVTGVTLTVNENIATCSSPFNGLSVGMVVNTTANPGAALPAGTVITGLWNPNVTMSALTGTSVTGSVLTVPVGAWNQNLYPGLTITASGGTGTLAGSTVITSITAGASNMTIGLSNAASVNGTLTSLTVTGGVAMLGQKAAFSSAIAGATLNCAYPGTIYDGQILYIQNAAAQGSGIVLVFTSGTTTQMILGAPNRRIGPGGTLTVQYDTTQNLWYEIGYAPAAAATNYLTTLNSVTGGGALTTVAPNANQGDITTFTTTALAGALTVSNPAGSPVDGQRLTIRWKTTNAMTSISWGTQYRFTAAATTFVKTNATSAAKWDYYHFIFNSADTAWDITSYALALQ